jgi:hypothetical protein
MVFEAARDILDSVSFPIDLNLDAHARQLRLESREQIPPFPRVPLLHME